MHEDKKQPKQGEINYGIDLEEDNTKGIFQVCEDVQKCEKNVKTRHAVELDTKGFSITP